MKHFHLLVLGACLLAWSACTQSTTTSSAAADSSATSGTPAPSASQQGEDELAQVEVRLQCKELMSPETGTPSAEVQLKIGADVLAVSKCMVCEDIASSQWADYHIPASAQQVVGGWYAGGGDYYYLQIEGEEAVVFYGVADEGLSIEESYQYKEIARHPIHR